MKSGLPDGKSFTSKQDKRDTCARTRKGSPPCLLQVKLWKSERERCGEEHTVTGNDLAYSMCFYLLRAQNNAHKLMTGLSEHILLNVRVLNPHTHTHTRTLIHDSVSHFENYNVFSGKWWNLFALFAYKFKIRKHSLCRWKFIYTRFRDYTFVS